MTVAFLGTVSLIRSLRRRFWEQITVVAAIIWTIYSAFILERPTDCCFCDLQAPGPPYMSIT